MKINDIVSRKSYKNDIWFRIVDTQEDNVILQRLNVSVELPKEAGNYYPMPYLCFQLSKRQQSVLY